MDNRELIDWCIQEAENNEYITFPAEIFDNLTENQAKMVSEHFGPTTMMKLPEYEIKFFEWLRDIEPKVWEDLWRNDPHHGPYIVAMIFLPLLVSDRSRGYPICDLMENDNYYFTKNHMVDEESKVMIETARKRFEARKPLTLTQLLALEISLDPIDIWHFAYKHNIDLYMARKTVHELVQDNALIHLTDAEHLAPFIEF